MVVVTRELRNGQPFAVSGSDHIFHIHTVNVIVLFLFFRSKFTLRCDWGASPCVPASSKEPRKDLHIYFGLGR